jgi:hypothetical protein
MFAVKVHNARAFKSLIDRGADPQALYDGDSKSSLWHFLARIIHSTSDECYQNRLLAIDTLDLLMHYKVDRQAVNKDGDTALHVLAIQLL